MIENTKETQRSICTSYGKDLTEIYINHYPDGTFDLDTVKDIFKEFSDCAYDQVMKDQLKSLSDAQLTKIDSLLRLVKPEPDTLRRINERKFLYNVKEASELIEQLIKDLPPIEHQDWLNQQSKRAEATAERSQRDA